MVLCASAQDRVMRRPFIDSRVWHWGFSVGLNTQYLTINNNGMTFSPQSQDGEVQKWYAQTESYAPGFNVGVLGALRLNEFMELRIVPTLFFGERTVGFCDQLNNKRSTQIIKSTYVGLPLELKIAGPRHVNFRPYALVGVLPVADLTVKKDKEILLNKSDCMIEIAFGGEIYYDYFKLIPELKFCFGLRNMLCSKRTDLKDKNMLKYTESVNSIYNKIVAFTLYFE